MYFLCEIRRKGNLIEIHLQVLDPLDFVSDSLDTKDQDLDEIREEMKKLGLSGVGERSESATIEGSSTTEEDWEKELDAEIQEFELVTSDRDLK